MKDSCFFLTKELSQDPYYEKAKSMSPDPPMELDGNIWVLQFYHHYVPLNFVNSCVCIICSGSDSALVLSFQSFDLESALQRTLFTAALFNELNFISVLVETCPLS